MDHDGYPVKIEPTTPIKPEIDPTVNIKIESETNIDEFEYELPEKNASCESYKKFRYKSCIVPLCHNNNRATPSKTFVTLPKPKSKKRESWLRAMKRDGYHFRKLSPGCCAYICVDHFNLEEDLENYCRFKLMGNVKLRMKEGVVPHVFECQKTYWLTHSIEDEDSVRQGPSNEVIDQNSKKKEIELPLNEVNNFLKQRHKDEERGAKIRYYVVKHVLVKNI